MDASIPDEAGDEMCVYGKDGRIAFGFFISNCDGLVRRCGRYGPMPP